MLISNEAQNYTSGQVLIKTDVNGNIINLMDQSGTTINTPLIDPTTGAVINPVTAQPYLMPSVNGDVEIAIVLAGESKTLPSDGVVGYRLIVHDAIATGAVTIADDDGTYAIPVGSIGLFEFQSSGDVTLGNSSNTGGPITVLEIA